MVFALFNPQEGNGIVFGMDFDYKMCPLRVLEFQRSPQPHIIKTFLFTFSFLPEIIVELV